MNDRIKSLFYIISSILVVGIVGYLAINLLIYLIPVLIAIYVIFKIKGYINGRKSRKSTMNYTYDNKSANNISIDDIYNSDDKVIDVEYEDVKK
ncbi:MAG: hypothetical protein HUJ77_13795 [Clostridium sp.]|uniref:hypothetical protein n=1 Tax=Clostridium sp. TaxID=1506 RepID=UPI0025C385ED|nr:hypothetical protein [Clostridium sp.]MCF0149452.1 hypothetical protein [Clostridium sp.]